MFRGNNTFYVWTQFEAHRGWNFEILKFSFKDTVKKKNHYLNLKKLIYNNHNIAAI